MTLRADIDQLGAETRRAASELPREELPNLLGTLATATAIAQSRLVQPAPAAAPESEELVTAAQLGEEWNIAPGWILERARQGRLPSHTFGRWKRFRRSEVEQALAATEGSDSKSIPLVASLKGNGHKGPRRPATASLPQNRART